MQNFVFQFEALLKYRKNQRDLCRQLLAQVLADDRNLLEKRKAFEQSRSQQLAQLRQFGGSGEVDTERSASRRYYAGQLLGDIRLVDRNREIVAQQLDLCREALTKADQEVKALEKLEEKQREEFRYVRERRAAHELEDVWLAAHAMEFLK